MKSRPRSQPASFNKFTYLKSLHGVDLTAPEFRVLVTLLNYTNQNGERAYPGIANLARDCCLSHSTVKRALRVLEEKGWLRKVSRGHGGGRGLRQQGLASEYALSFPAALGPVGSDVSADAGRTGTVATETPGQPIHNSGSDRQIHGSYRPNHVSNKQNYGPIPGEVWTTGDLPSSPISNYQSSNHLLSDELPSPLGLGSNRWEIEQENKPDKWALEETQNQSGSLERGQAAATGGWSKGHSNRIDYDNPLADTALEDHANELVNLLKELTDKRSLSKWDSQNWLKSARILLKSHGRPYDQACELLHHTRVDHYWTSKITSMFDLVVHYEGILEEYNRCGPQVIDQQQARTRTVPKDPAPTSAESSTSSDSEYEELRRSLMPNG